MSKIQEMSFFDRYLTLWVAICIVAGIALGKLLPIVPEILDCNTMEHTYPFSCSFRCNPFGIGHDYPPNNGQEKRTGIF